MEALRVPRETNRVELEVKRSRFIADACAVESRAAADAAVRERRREFPDATHVVYAWRVGTPRSEVLGQSDDGEPKGTAGRPVLEVLKGSGITNCLVTVVRYYGGTKLGTGGLVRAYGEAAKMVLSGLVSDVLEVRVVVSCTAPYELHGMIRRRFEAEGVTEIEERFDSEVTMVARVVKAQFEGLQQTLRDVSRGTIELQRQSDEAVPTGEETAAGST